MKKQLTFDVAERLCSAYLSKVNDPKLRSFLLVHSTNVSKTADMLGKLQGLDNALLKIAGFVHDIGYSIEEENHARHSLEILEQLGYNVDDTLKDCILNHGSNCKPLTREGKLFQVVDKISIIDSNVLSILFDKIPFSQKDVSVLKEFLSNASNSLDRL